MNQLKDYIGIKGFGAAPASGQYVNQLPGISLKAVQSIANSEQVTFLGAYSDVQDRAWLRLSGDFKNLMRAKYCLEKDTDTDAIVGDDKELFTNAWLYILGAELMFERLYSERLNGFTLLGRDKVEELRDLYTGLYENALDDLMPAIRWKNEDELLLTQKFSRIERLP